MIITGDIFHSKNEVSPELYYLAYNMFRLLDDIGLSTLIIPGNHDANLANSSRIDSLTPLLEFFNDRNGTKSLYYMRDSGIMRTGDVVIGHLSVFDRREFKNNWPKVTDFGVTKEDKKRIFLYHGPVEKSVSPANFRLESDIKLNRFNGWDWVMLGDIHMRQILQNAIPSKRIPWVAYAGSWIQMNHGETLDGHGWLEWDLEDKEKEPIGYDINIDWRFITIDVDGANDLILWDPKNLSRKYRIRIRSSNHIPQQIIDEVRNKWNWISPWTVLYKPKNQSNSHLQGSQIDTKYITDSDYQKELINDWLTNNNHDKKTIEKVLEVHDIISDGMVRDTTTNLSSIQWKPITLEWSNLFSYGKNNKIDFTTLDGIVSLWGDNASGKTAIMNIILFALFDKSTKDTKSQNMINYHSDHFDLKFIFEISQKRYMIHRAGETKKNKYSYKVNLFEYSEIESDWINISGKNRYETNDIIISKIGSYDNFIITSMAEQNSSKNFIDLRNSERKDMLLHWIGAEIFDKFYDKSQEIIKEMNYDKNRLEQSILNKSLDDLENSLDILKSRKNSATKEYEKLLAEKEELSNQIVLLDQSLGDWIIIKQDIPEKEKSINIYKNKINESETKINKYNEDLKKLNQSWDRWDNKEYKEYLKNKNEGIKISEKLTKLNHEIITVHSKLEKLKDLEYDPNCTYCMNNIFVKDAIESKGKYEDLSKEKDLLDIELEKIIELIEEPSKYYEGKNYDYYLLQKSQIEEKIASEKEKILTWNDSLKTFEKDLNKLDEKLKKLDNLDYDELSDKLNKLKISKNNLVIKIESQRKEENRLTAEIVKSENELITFKENKETFSNIEENIGYYKIYNQLMGRNGVPHSIVLKTIEALESEVNNILSTIVPFRTVITVDDDSYKSIDINIVYFDNSESAYWNIDMGSGMEKFITGLAFRIALMNMGSAPRPAFMMIDEGFGVLSDQNMAQIPNLFEALRYYFQYVLIVSHIDTIKAMTDQIIEIQKAGKWSKIVNN